MFNNLTYYKMDNSLVTLRTFSLSYQHIFNDGRVPRPNLVHEIEDMFDKDCKLVIIEGKEGAGKTDILLQFSKKHSFDSITFFINPAFRASYRQDYLMEDVGKQIYFFNKNEFPPTDLEITEGVFNKLAFDLTTSPGRRNKPVYFLLDGLDQIEKSDFELLKNGLQNLPWNINNFYFLVSGTIEKLKDILPSIWMKNFKSIRVPRFTENETSQLFKLDDTIKSQKFLHEIHNTWKGHPESLSQVKRIIDSGISTDEFLEKFDISEKNDLLEIEWRRAEVSGLDINSPKILIISLLAFDDNIRRADRIASIVNISTTELYTIVSEVTFLIVNEENIAFASNSYRQYAIVKLKRFEKETNAKLIEFYMQLDDINSILNLPTLFHKNNEWGNIVNLLTIDNLDLIVSNSRSFSDIKKQINYGYKAAKSLKRSYENLFRFSLHRSILIGLQSSDSQKDRIKAYIVLNRPEEAFSLIANSVLKEDRLKMLIYFVQQSKIEKKDVDSLIINEVKDLLQDIDIGYLRENLMDLAIGLAYFLPNEAIQLIERALGLKKDNNSIEWLMGIVGLIAHKNKVTNSEDKLQIETNDTSKISFVDKFAKSIGYGINEVSEVEIIPELEKIEKVSDRLFLVRKWIKSNSQNPQIYDIINYALNLLTQESSIIKPSTESLFDIVFPIKYFNDHVVIHSMIERIDDLMITINSPTIGKVLLHIVIIEALINVDIEEANNRTITLSAFIDNLADISIKLEAYANFWKMYRSIQKNNTVNLDSLLLDEKYLKEEISKVTSVFLSSIAEQHEEIEPSLIILAQLDFAFTLNIANSLNTLIRRDSAIVTCLESYIEKNIDEWLQSDIEFALSIISLDTYKTEGIVAVFEALYDQKDAAKNMKYLTKDLLPLINNISGNSNKCITISSAIILLGLEQTNNPKYLPRYDTLIEKLNQFLLNFYDKLESPLEKIKIGYRLASSLGNYDKKLAEQYFDLAESYSKDNTLDDITHIGLLIESIRIMIRIYAGLVRKNEFSYEKISYLIGYVTTKEDQIRLWSELAVRVALAGQGSLSKEIVSSKIIPVLENYKKNKDHAGFYNILKKSASSIHLTQPASLILYLNSLTIQEKESIIPLVFIVLLSNCYETDPFDDLKGATHFTYQSAIEYIDLLDCLETDQLIHHYVRSLTKIVKVNPNIFTRIQKPELYRKLSELVIKKLPNKKTGIVHNGYLICAKACLENLNISSNDKILQCFNQLEIEVSTINNTTDRVVVYLNLVLECDNKKKKIELIRKAFEDADKILSIKERISMYEAALEIALKTSVELFNYYLKICEKDIYNLDESEQYPSFKKLIDLAYRYDKNIAQRLISNLDTDPARKKMSEPANNHFEKLDLEKSAESDYSQLGKIKDRREKCNFAWNLLSQLNSQKRKGREISETMSFLYSASTMPFFYSIPLYEFFVENVIKSDDKENLLLSFYESANSNAKLCYNLICNISNKNSSTLSYTINLSNNSIIVSPGMHKEANEFIKNFVTGTESKEIYIVDPYFSDKEMIFLKNLDDWCYSSTVTVLTSSEASGNFNRDTYVDAWEKYSSEIPPANTFIRAKNQSNKSPFHDRYIILYDKKLGLRMGASINGINGQKTFEISKMLATEVDTVYETIIKPFVFQRLKEHQDQTIKYESFDF